MCSMCWTLQCWCWLSPIIMLVSINRLASKLWPSGFLSHSDIPHNMLMIDADFPYFCWSFSFFYWCWFPPPKSLYLASELCGVHTVDWDHVLIYHAFADSHSKLLYCIDTDADHTDCKSSFIGAEITMLLLIFIHIYCLHCIDADTPQISDQPVNCVDWSPDKLGLLATASFDQKLRVVFVTKRNLI